MRQKDKSVLLPEFEAAHLDEVLRNLGDALLALVDREVGPVDQLFVDLRVRRQFNRPFNVLGANEKRGRGGGRTCSSALE